MPQVILTEEARRKKQFENFIRNRSRDLKIPHRVLADKCCNTNPPHFSRKLVECRFNYWEVVSILHTLKASEEDVKNLIWWKSSDD